MLINHTEIVHLTRNVPAAVSKPTWTDTGSSVSRTSEAKPSSAAKTMAECTMEAVPVGAL